MPEISDRLEAMRNVMSLGEVASLIERTAKWVAATASKSVISSGAPPSHREKTEISEVSLETAGRP